MAALAALLYAVILQQCYSTIGEPYAQALIEIEKLQDAGEIADDWEIADEQAKKMQSKLNKIYGITDLDGVEEEDEEEELPEADLAFSDDNDSENKTSPKEDDETIRPPLPPQYLPNPWAFAALFMMITFHVLFHLMCHWLPWFKLAALYEPSSDIVPGSFVQITPKQHRGKTSIEVVQKSKLTGRMQFEFQRQKYEYYTAKELNGAQLDTLTGGDGNDPAVVLVESPTTGKVSSYVQATGLVSSELGLLTENFGKNKLSIAQPQFLDLFKQQLLSPLAMFQFFTSALWMMDEYWQYTMFSILNIFMFESTTVYQRLRTMKTLSGMSTKPYAVHVYRSNSWTTISTLDLLPGDIVSLKRKYVKPQPKPNQKQANGAAQKKPANEPAASDVVPCDCVILRGSAVVNEATLTGESVPLMKDALESKSNAVDRDFDMNGEHRVHVLFSGTSLVSSTGGSEPTKDDAEGCSIPNPPDQGCICKVLRTGFSSSQGELIQMIEFSTQQVSADSKETLLALGILLIFALASALYVLKKGLEKGDRTTHELLLKCVIIITSVVPQQLPMQMALAVNTALMNLMKKGIFCTEPYRVQFAGKITHCLFDKTGTLTTDQLIPAGVLCGTSQSKEPKLVPVLDASHTAAAVLGSCHALVHIEEAGLIGDPIELASLGGIEWSYDASTQTSKPGNSKKREMLLEKQTSEIAKVPEINKKDALAKLDKIKESIKRSKAVAENTPYAAVKILNRHHFSSKLQRMSVVSHITGKAGQQSGHCCLVKGSPEMLKTLLKPDEIPEWYDRSHRAKAEEGMRMLALAYKWCPSDVTSSDLINKPREWVESDLCFAGFVAFECKIRADSGIVISALKDSAHGVGMLTGDATLTAYHVAKELGICDKDKTPLELRVISDPNENGENGKVEWSGMIGPDSESLKVPFKSPGMKELAETYELIVTGNALEVAAQCSNNAAMKEVEVIHVFARMSPQGKASVIRSMQEQHDYHVFMCGDGGNDVGALKQANVGLALLGGYGNSNTGEIKADGKTDKTKNGADAEQVLNETTKAVATKSAEITKKVKEHMNKKRSELMKAQQQWLQEAIANGEGYFSAIKSCTARMQQEMRDEQLKLRQLYGDAYSTQDSFEAMGQMEVEDALPIVRPGDASVAAPFTSRAPSIKAVVDLIRQGRCTLLSALQQQQIMMLQSIVSAYTISALSLEGARSSERQMMASGWLIMIASLAFSYSTPIEKMHPQRPLKSLFHPAIFISMLGQAAIHLGCMIYSVSLATEIMGPAKLREVLEFHKKNRAGELEIDDEEDPWAQFNMIWSAPFLPNLMNTVIFLVETSQIIAILLVNYKGRPWMLGVTENHALALSLFVTIGGLVTCAWGVSPELNRLIHLEEFPDDNFRYQVIALVGISLAGTFLWDRLITMIFSPKIFKAMLDEAKATTVADLIPVIMTLVKVCVGFAVFASGNILLWLGVGWYFWKRRQTAN